MVDYGVMRRSVFRLFFFFSFSEHSVRDFGELLRRAGPSYFSCVILSLWTILFPFFGFLSGWRACMLTIGLYSFPFFFFPFPFFFFFSFPLSSFLSCFFLFFCLCHFLESGEAWNSEDFFCVFGANVPGLRPAVIIFLTTGLRIFLTNQCHAEHTY